jgi:hypothetical protein
MKENVDGHWQKVEDKLSLELSKDKHVFFFRSVNLADVTGPESKIIIIKENG